MRILLAIVVFLAVCEARRNLRGFRSVADRRRDILARRAMGRGGRMNLRAMRQSRTMWNSQNRELKARQRDFSLSRADRDAAYQQRRAEILSRRFAGRNGRLAMAQGNAGIASDRDNVIQAVNGIKRGFNARVATAAGFSGQGYENAEGAKRWLNSRFRDGEIMGGGSTKAGVGQIGYDVARERGARSIGIASSEALKYGMDGVYTHRNHQNFFVKDSSWGGINKETGKLYDTSEALVGTTDRYMAAGGGGVMADEARAMMSRKGRESVDVDVFQGNHATAQKKYEKALAKGDPNAKLDTSYGVGNSQAIYRERYGVDSNVIN